MSTESGLVTAAARVTAGKLEASASREENVLDDSDPTYPDQTVLGARYKLGADASLFYTQRISDDPIVPIGDFSGTGFSALPTTSELNIGIESRVADNTRLTSRYQIDQGISGPDAFAVIGAVTQINLGRGLAGTFGGERGTLVKGAGDNYTSGTFGVAYVGSRRFKASARYEGREREGYSGLFSAGAAARVTGGVTALARGEWLDSPPGLIQTDSRSVLAAFAVRPATSDRVGALFSYQFVDRNTPIPAFGQPGDALGWRHRLSTDGYVQPARRVELYGKLAWQQSSDPGRFVSTYLGQGRVQIRIMRFLDVAAEERYIWQPDTDSNRAGGGLELGVWAIADMRAAVGFSFNDTRDPLGRDSEGRARGVYVTFSTKLSRLFNLMGSAPPAAEVRR